MTDKTAERLNQTADGTDDGILILRKLGDRWSVVAARCIGNGPSVIDACNDLLGQWPSEPTDTPSNPSGAPNPHMRSRPGFTG